MSYETRAYDKPNTDGFPSDPVVVLVATGHAWKFAGGSDCITVTPADAPPSTQVINLLNELTDTDDRVSAGSMSACSEHHWGRGWALSETERNCPCPKAACGYVILGREAAGCSLHADAQTMRGGHPVGRCPGGAR